MPTWEPAFVAVVGGTEAARRSLIQGLVDVLSVLGRRATRLDLNGPPRRRASCKAVPIWQHDVIFVEELEGAPVPRIVVAPSGGLLEAPRTAGGNVIAVVEPPAEPNNEARGCPKQLLDEIARGIAKRLGGS